MIIRLNQEFRQELTLWQEFFQTWNGLSFFCMPMWVPILDFQVSSDAAGSLGYGAFFNAQWFCGACSMKQKSILITYKELFPIVVDAALWGSEWVSQQVEFLCNNESVVSVLKSGSSWDQHLMGFLHHLSLLAICHSFVCIVSSVRGKVNPVGDSLSHFQFEHFCCLTPQADLTLCVIP